MTVSPQHPEWLVWSAASQLNTAWQEIPFVPVEQRGTGAVTSLESVNSVAYSHENPKKGKSQQGTQKSTELTF